MHHARLPVLPLWVRIVIVVLPFPIVRNVIRAAVESTLGNEAVELLTRPAFLIWMCCAIWLIMDISLNERERIR